MPAPFTSLGPASDGDIKPNVAAMGWNIIMQRANGTIGTGNGTSFSAPLIAGAAACLWQTRRDATAKDIKQAIERSAHLHDSPDSLAGYGIPDFKLALEILNASGQTVADKKSIWEIHPNPFNDFIELQKHIGINQGKIQLAFFSLDGKLIRIEEKQDAAKIRITNLQNLPAGILLLQIRTENSVEVAKIVRLNGAETNTF